MRHVSRWILLCTMAAAPAAAADFSGVFKGYEPEGPGCAVGVARQGQPATFTAYGLADLEHAVPISAETVMEAGSIAKQFTAASILMLAEEGKLALTDDIRKYLPEMPDYGTPITINHLLSHTNGLRDWGGVSVIAGWPRSYVVRTNDEVYEITTRQRALNYKPGDAYSYNNTGFNLAAFIVERVSGKSLPEFTRERMFAPLGMSKTSWRDDFRRIVPDRAIAYREKTAEGYHQEMPFEDNYGHGGLLTTVRDMLTWNDALTNRKFGEFVTKHLEEQAVLNDGRKIGYARGLQHGSYNGVPEISHGGGTAAYRAWLARYPTKGVSVAVLCNGETSNAAKVARDAIGVVDPVVLGAPAAPPKPSAVTAAELSQLPGLYIDERTGRSARVVAAGGGLKFAEGTREVDLVRLAARRYRNGGAELTFKDATVESRTADGEVTALCKVDAYTPSAPELAALAGRYTSAEADSVLQVSVKDGRLVLAPVNRPSAAAALTPLSRDVFKDADGLITVVCGSGGKVEGIRFIHPRVYSLVFTRAAG